MKIRKGFVSNSSSSSFVVVRDALTDKQEDMIIEYQEWVKFFSNKDDKLKEKFEYYDSDPWDIYIKDDYILGSTSMDNFSFYDYLDYIEIDKNFICWDDGWNSEPHDAQFEFLKRAKQKIRKNKIDNINKKE